MEETVLVTGIDSFSGFYVANELLNKGFNVVGTSRKGIEVEKLNGKVQTLQLDLTNSQQVNDVVNSISPQYVINLAAVTNVTHSNINEIYSTNVDGVHNLLKSLANMEIKTKKCILLSSANIYGNSENPLLKETDTPNPANDYARSKLQMESLANDFVNAFDINIVRPFNFTGVGQSTKFLAAKIVDHFRAKAKKIELGNIRVFRDFSDVRDVASYIVALMIVRDKSGEIYNICSGKQISLEEIIQICEDITKHKIEINVNPDFVRPNEIYKLGGDPSKINAATNQLPTLNIKDTLAWMLEN